MSGRDFELSLILIVNPSLISRALAFISSDPPGSSTVDAADSSARQLTFRIFILNYLLFNFVKK